MKFLESDRLYLRNLVSEDVEEICDYKNDEEGRKHQR